MTAFGGQTSGGRKSQQRNQPFTPDKVLDELRRAKHENQDVAQGFASPPHRFETCLCQTDNKTLILLLRFTRIFSSLFGYGSPIRRSEGYNKIDVGGSCGHDG
jgi:hypothetical protein